MTVLAETAASEILTGNQAVARAAFAAKTQVVAAYPITPQTTIVESLAELMKKATWKNRFINVESEHSALAACIGASMTGARVFTATSSQGLALMHELLHWAAAARLPIVLANVNRALAPGWNIWTDQQDSLSQRDTGWIQIYCENNQDVFDSVLEAFRLAETVRIPVMVVLDAFVLSHTGERVELPPSDEIDAFLPTVEPPFKLDVENPRAFGGLLGPDHFQEVRRRLHEDMLNAEGVFRDIESGFAERFGREGCAVEGYRIEGAEIALVTSGTVTSTAREVVDDLRARGVAAGLVKVRLFRPFPSAELSRLLEDVPRVAVIDRNVSFGHHGIFHQELKSALYHLPADHRPEIHGFITGLGGRDVTPARIQQCVTDVLQRERTNPETVWI